MRRWMPDLDLRPSASFISSNEGDTPEFGETAIDVNQQLVLLASQHGRSPEGRLEQKQNR